MARKVYHAQDEDGRPWIVAIGDPAYGLVSRLRSSPLTLPFYALVTGAVVPVDDSVYLRRLARSAEAAPQDEELALELVRAVQLKTCLDEIAAARVILTEPEEATKSG